MIIEARFDGELMSTDAVDHNTNPDFNMELAWEVDRKGLHVLRISRTPIKVQCYAIDKKTSSKSAVGYVILDIRLAQFESMVCKNSHNNIPYNSVVVPTAICSSISGEFISVLSENIFFRSQSGIQF